MIILRMAAYTCDLRANEILSRAELRGVDFDQKDGDDGFTALETFMIRNWIMLWGWGNSPEMPWSFYTTSWKCASDIRAGNGRNEITAGESGIGSEDWWRGRRRRGRGRGRRILRDTLNFGGRGIIKPTCTEWKGIRESDLYGKGMIRMTYNEINRLDPKCLTRKSRSDLLSNSTSFRKTLRNSDVRLNHLQTKLLPILKSSDRYSPHFKPEQTLLSWSLWVHRMQCLYLDNQGSQDLCSSNNISSRKHTFPNLLICGPLRSNSLTPNFQLQIRSIMFLRVRAQLPFLV